MSPAAIPAWAADAGRRLADLGFVDVHGSEPGAPGGTRLLVALRSTPTLAHFDPESLTCWAFQDGRGRLLTFDRHAIRPADLPVSWGRVSVADRIPVSNQFLTFGGRLRAADFDDDTTLVELTSPAPIQRWSGHSQGIDPFTDEIGAFFGRLMIPIDFTPGAEGRIGEAGPLALYAAMLQDSVARLAASPTLREHSTQLDRFLHHELARLQTTEPTALDAGRALLSEVGIVVGSAG
jgi:hypothetical protein